MRPFQEKRLKRFFINPELLMMFLRSERHWPSCFLRGHAPDLPEDAVLHDVSYSPVHRALVAIVHHPSFAEAGDGEEIPIGTPVNLEIQAVWHVRRDDGSYSLVLDKQEALSRFVAQARSDESNEPSQPESESSLDWFQRVMSKSD